MNKQQKQVDEVFTNSFGRTPLGERLQDILGEAIELSRYTDLPNLKEEAGDLLASTLQLCTECGWNANDLIKNTLTKIKAREKQYKALGRKVKVAILGGAFDPPTLGHIALAKFVLDASKTFDEVWLMPCNKHMYNKKMQSAEHRLEMCRIAASVDPRIKVFDYEIKHNLRGETYNFVKRLQNEDFAKHEYDFSIIIGMDNANTFDKWVNAKELERMIRFVVVSRQGVKRDEKVNWYLNAPHIYMVAETNIPETSSTDARELLRLPSLCGKMVPVLLELIDKNVYKYAVDNRLYKEQT